MDVGLTISILNVDINNVSDKLAICFKVIDQGMVRRQIIYDNHIIIFKSNVIIFKVQSPMIICVVDEE